MPRASVATVAGHPAWPRSAGRPRAGCSATTRSTARCTPRPNAGPDGSRRSYGVRTRRRAEPVAGPPGPSEHSVCSPLPMRYVDDATAWAHFRAEHRRALLGERDAITWNNDGYGLHAHDGSVHGALGLYPMCQDPVEPGWFAALLDAPAPDGGGKIAAVLLARALGLSHARRRVPLPPLPARPQPRRRRHPGHRGGCGRPRLSPTAIGASASDGADVAERGGACQAGHPCAPQGPSASHPSKGRPR